MQKVWGMKQEANVIGWGIAICVTAILVNFPNLSIHHLVTGNDLMFHLSRIEGIQEGLLSGQMPVRLNPFQLSGYGMPTSLFYPDLFLYVPALLRICGVSLITAWKAFLLLVSFLTAFASWWAFSTYTRSVRTGAIATLFYLVAFYRLLAMYISIGVGMLLGMAFLPAAMMAVWLTLRRKASYWPAVVLFATCILQSHIITSILFLGAVVVMTALSCWRFRLPEGRWAAVEAAGFTAVLNLWFYLPMLYFHRHMDYLMKSVTHEGIQLVIYSFLEADCYIGSAMLALFFVVVLVAFWKRWRFPATFWILIVLSAGLILLMVSRTPWEGWLGRVFSFLQFPNRFVLFPTFFCALAMGMAFSQVRRNVIIGVCVLLCLVSNYLWVFGSAYAIPHGIAKAQRESVEGFQQRFEREIGQSTGYRDYMDAEVNRQLQSPDDLARKTADQSLHPADRIGTAERRGNDFVLHCVAGDEAWVELPLFWYAGYAAENLETGEALSVRRDDEGQVSVLLPPSSGRVHVWYAGLPWFRIVDGISFLGLLAFLYACKREWNRRKEGAFA